MQNGVSTIISKWRNKQGRPLKNDKKRFTTSYFKMLQTKPSKMSTEHKKNIMLHVDSNLNSQTTLQPSTSQSVTLPTVPHTENTKIPTTDELKPIFRPVTLSEKDMIFVHAFYENPLPTIIVSRFFL